MSAPARWANATASTSPMVMPGSAAWAAVVVAMARRRFPDVDPDPAEAPVDSPIRSVRRQRWHEALIVLLVAPILGLAAGARFGSVGIALLIACFLVLCVV